MTLVHIVALVTILLVSGGVGQPIICRRERRKRNDLIHGSYIR